MKEGKGRELAKRYGSYRTQFSHGEQQKRAVIKSSNIRDSNQVTSRCKKLAVIYR
jgi:hypothetical protein